MIIENWELEIPMRETLAGDAARKHARRKVLGLVMLVGCCLAGGLGFAYWTSQCPVEVGLASIDPGLMADRSLIVTLGFRNPDSAPIHLNMSCVQAEAKEGARWVKVGNLWAGSSSLMPNCKTMVLLQVPNETEACRIRLQYSLPTFKERVMAWRQVHQLPTPYLTSLLDQWLWTPQPFQLGVPPPRRWTEANFVIGTPRELGRVERD